MLEVEGSVTIGILRHRGVFCFLNIGDGDNPGQSP